MARDYTRLGEILLHPPRRQSLDWTGERMVPGLGGQIEFEHYHRYLLARELCRDKNVLDVASGEGYGSAFLAQVAKSVVGVDSSGVAVAHSADAYSEIANLSFVCSDAIAIPLPDHSVDVVVSFETLEHLVEHDAFLKEMKRILISDGLLIISTPDRDNYSGSNAELNPFHLKELSRDEFGALMSSHFAHSRVYDQRVIVGSTIWPADGEVRGEGSRIFERRDEASFQSSTAIPNARYMIAFGSSMKLPELQTSLYFDQDKSGASESTNGIAASQDLGPSNAGLESLLSFATSVQDDYVRRLNEANVQLEMLSNIRLELTANLAAAHANATHSVGQAEIYRGQIADLNQRLHNFESQAEKLLEVIRSLGREGDELKSRISDLERQNKALLEADETRSKHHDDAPRMNAEIQREAMRGLVRQHASLIERLHHELRTLENSPVERDREFEALRSQYMERDSQFESLRSQYMERDSQFETLQSQYMERDSEFEALRSQYDALFDRYRKLTGMARWLPAPLKRSLASIIDRKKAN